MGSVNVYRRVSFTVAWLKVIHSFLINLCPFSFTLHYLRLFESYDTDPPSLGCTPKLSNFTFRDVLIYTQFLVQSPVWYRWGLTITFTGHLLPCGVFRQVVFSSQQLNVKSLYGPPKHWTFTLTPFLFRLSDCLSL